MIGHFSKFCRIPWQYQNSAKKGKVCGSAQNSAARRKHHQFAIRKTWRLWS